jgi:hypothetical protein
LEERVKTRKHLGRRTLPNEEIGVNGIQDEGDCRGRASGNDGVRPQVLRQLFARELRGFNELPTGAIEIREVRGCGASDASSRLPARAVEKHRRGVIAPLEKLHRRSAVEQHRCAGTRVSVCGDDHCPRFGEPPQIDERRNDVRLRLRIG